MSLETVKSYLSTQLTTIRDAYIKDLEKMSEDDLVIGVEGPARKGIDFTYEVAYVNRRFTTRLIGETPEAWPEGGWMVAPDEFRTKDAIINEFRESMDLIIQAWEGIPADEILRVIELPGENTSPLDLVHSCCVHTMYHNAQLNYIQEIKGDMTVPWQS